MCVRERGVGRENERERKGGREEDTESAHRHIISSKQPSLHRRILSQKK